MVAALSERKAYIDTLRALACVLLVVYHVIGAKNTALQVQTGALRHGTDLLGYIRMPLFTILSGMVYGARPYIPAKTNAAHFIKGKARRLLFPVLTVGTTYAFLRQTIAGVEINWKYLHLIPVDYFWFVEALFIVFLLVIGFEHLKIFENLRAYLTLLVSTFLLFVFLFKHLPEQFYLPARVLFLLPYFLIGAGVSRFKVDKKVTIKPWVILGTLAIIIPLFSYLNWNTEVLWYDPYGIAFGAIVCVGLILLKPQIKLLSKIGPYSYSIYIFHGFFISFAKTTVEVFNMNYVLAHIVVGLVLSILGAILLEKILITNTFTALTVLGTKIKPLRLGEIPTKVTSSVSAK